MTAPDLPDQLATVAQLQVWMGFTFSTADAARAAYILRVASSWARHISGKIWADPLAPDFPISVNGIIVAAGRREMENPGRFIHETAGPEAGSRLPAAVPDGFFTEAECKFLKKFRPGGGLFTIRTMKDSEEETLAYIHVLGSSKPLPYFNQGDPGWYEAEKY
jgi:hypothetical protein